MKFPMFRVAVAGVFLSLSSSSVAVAAIFLPASVPDLIADITTANSNGENDVVDLGNLTFTLTASNNGIDGSNGLPSITEDGFSLTIQHGKIERSGGDMFRLLHVATNASLLLNDVTLSNGLAYAGGSGVGQGGAVFSRGLLTTTDCTFSANLALGLNDGFAPEAGIGGAIAVEEGTYSDSGSTFDSNQARGGDALPGVVATAGDGRGGAIYASASGSILQITNSVFTSNQAIGGAAVAAGGGGGAGGLAEGGALYFAGPAGPVTA